MVALRLSGRICAAVGSGRGQGLAEPRDLRLRLAGPAQSGNAYGAGGSQSPSPYGAKLYAQSAVRFRILVPFRRVRRRHRAGRLPGN